MAENEAPPEPTPEAASSAPAGPSLLARIKVGVFVLLVLGAECVLGYLLFPSAEQTAATAQKQIERSDEPDIELNDELADQQPEPQIEVDLGQYAVTAFHPGSNTTLRLDFTLFGVILEKDQLEFDPTFEASKHRIRHQVIITARNSEISDLTDAGLGLIKRKILEKINRSLGKPYLQDVVFSDFSFVEE